MEKKDYYSLQSKYSFLQDYLKRYRKDLKDFIDEAFEKHGSEFVLKPEDCDTWKEADEIDHGLDAMERIPTVLFIDSKNKYEREIYPTKIYRRNGRDTHYVNGYDYDDCEFVNGLRANDDTDSLESIAEFINAVLGQEQEGNIRRCEHCGKPMKEGYYLGGEFACSDECCLALYNGDKKQMEEDLSHADEADGECYWTEWESIYFDD